MTFDSQRFVPGARARARGIALVAAVAALFAVGCYKPTIKEGGFVCGDVSKYLQECPDGFRCVAGLCKKGPNVDAAVDLSSEVKPMPDAVADKPTSDAIDAVDSRADQAEVCVPPAPVAGCTVADPMKKCDPLCQTGCGCQGKCSVNTLGDLTCNPPSGTLRRKEGESCEPVSPGKEQQTDDCAAGLVCINQACGSLCARFCRVDKDCPGSTCSREVMGGLKVCDVPLVDCNPIRSAGPARCPGAAQGCYLSPTVQDRTICDCPFNSQKEGDPCTFSRDCFPGLACVDALGVGVGGLHCQIVCSLTSGGCAGVQTCRSLNGSKVFGFCF